MLEDDTTLSECRRQAIAMCTLQFVSLLTKEGICSNGTITTIRMNRKDRWVCQVQFFLDHLFFILALQLINIQIRFIYQCFSWKRCFGWNSENPAPVPTQQGAPKYTETLTHLSSTALSPQLWLSVVFWLDLSPLTYSISQGCYGQIGRLVVWLPPRSDLAEGSFIFK